ncbi:chemotaxis protein CheB [Mucilaginibacter sp.]
MPEILQKLAPFPVHQITDNIYLEPDSLYIIPNNKIVITFDGLLKLDSLEKKHSKSNTIDLFFSSPGVVHQSFVGGINDGTSGSGNRVER